MLLYGINAFFPVEAEAIFTSDPVRVNVYLVSAGRFVQISYAVSDSAYSYL